jgi:Raf kinase inhibitor-like YbhB/YbcL family protein
MPGDASTRCRSALGVRGRGRTLTLTLALAAGALVAAACGSDGQALRPPSPDQTTTTVATSQPAGSEVGAGSGDSASSETLPEPMRLISPVIPEGSEIPAQYTCRGAEVSPPLEWTPAPAGTVELALVVRDIDAEGLVQWVVAGLAPTTGGLAEGAVPAEAVQATNDFGRPGWAGPCPTSGTHHYDIRIYALAQPSGVADGQPGAEAAAAVESTPAVMSAVLSATASAG